ncbi:MAG: outer membrane lipoprotein-sorting protein [Nitrospinota bacterium]
MKYALTSILAALTVMLSLLTAAAQTPQEKGLAIAVEADKRDNGYGDSVAKLLMVLKNRHGAESRRKMRIKTLEVQGKGDISEKGLIIFDSPPDVKGTAMLTYTHKVDDDDQWLYLPALKRVKRISSSNRSGSFMGSEFSYEDLGGQEVEKYTYKWLHDEQCPGDEYKQLNCFVYERYPKDKNSGYTRQVVRMDQKEYRPIKIDFYDRKKSLLKTLTGTDYKRYLGKYWRPNKMEMINHQSGKNTLLIYDNYNFRTGLKENDFTQASLKRIR